MNVDHVRKRGKIEGDEANYLISSPHLNDPTKNPCIIEQNLQSKCMYENGHNSHACADEAFNYRDCQRFWNIISWKRRFNGIRPHMPLPEERAKIKKKYFEKIKKDYEELRKDMS